MAVNLVSMSSEYITSDLTERIASTLGADRRGVGRATNAAIPALLASLASLATSRDGALKVDAAVSQSSPGVLDNMASALGAGGGKTFMDRGMSSLGSLFGTSSVSALGNAVGNFSGIGTSKGSSLLVMLAPMILGLLSKQKSERNLDASGIARLLGDQRDNIDSAMPPDFKRVLEGAGLTSIAGLTSRPAEQPAGQTSWTAAGGQAGTSRPADRPAERTYRAEGGRTERRPGLPRWLMWALPLLALLVLALWFFGDRGGEVTDTRQPATMGEAQLAATLNTTLNNVSTALGNVDDEQSARAALPRLTAARAELESIAELSAQLPAERREALTRAAANAYPEIDRLARQALAAPGVETVAGSEITAIRDRLAALGRR